MAGPTIPAPPEPPAASATGDVRARGGGLRRPRVSPWVQAGLIGLGGVLMAIGVAGLVLPGIQGVVTILAGLVVVSLGSPGAHRWTRRSLRRWPRLLGLYEKMRRGLLRRRFRRSRTVPARPGA
jgi:hypothetical protein